MSRPLRLSRLILLGAIALAPMALALPLQLGDAEIQNEINSIISETGASGIKDMGKVMAALKPRLAGKADMAKVSGLVKGRLSG